MSGPQISDQPRLGTVFRVSIVLSVAFVTIGSAAPEWLTGVLGATGEVVDQFGPVYPLTVVVVLLFVVILAVTPYGRIRLGEPDSRPEFGNVSWFAMVFSAGVGLSLSLACSSPKKR